MLPAAQGRHTCCSASSCAASSAHAERPPAALTRALHARAVAPPHARSLRACHAPPPVELHQVDRVLEGGRAPGAVCSRRAQISVGAVGGACASSGCSAHLCIEKDLEPWCSPTLLRRPHAGPSCSCTRARCSSAWVYVLHTARTQCRRRHRCDPGISGRVGAMMSHLDGYTRSRSANVAIEVRQRASCAVANARVTGRSADQGAGVKTPQRVKFPLEIK